jgi:hypothetical protein
MIYSDNIRQAIAQANQLLPLAAFSLDADLTGGDLPDRHQLANIVALTDAVAAILTSFGQRWRAALDQRKDGETIWK